MWAIFRIEWEVVVKVYSASYATMPLTSATAASPDDRDSDARSAPDDEALPITRARLED